MKPIPDNVKDILGQLPGPQQVALRTYIASLRSEIKDLEADLLAKNDADPHAHYHGHDKCTADHSHSEHAHHGEEKEHPHDHDHKEKGHAHDHDHKKDHHEHAHDHHKDHHEHEKCTEDHDHHHDHKKHEEHDHGHKHGHAKDDDMPAWKKKALESGASDPMAAPFGGDWKAESSLSASDKMEE